MYDVSVRVNLYASHSVQLYRDVRQILPNFTQDHTYFVALNMALILITLIWFLLYALHTEVLNHDAAKMPVEPQVLR